MYHHRISDVFALRHKKKMQIPPFITKGRLPIQVAIFLFVLLMFTINFFTLPSSVNAQSPFQPTRASIYGTFYYPWYKNKSVDGTWSFWQDSSHSPPNSWYSNYLPLPPGTYNVTTRTFNSAAGLYSSRDKNNFYWQINMMAQAKLEFAISSWWGRSISATDDSAGPNAVEGKSDLTFRKIITDWMNQTDNPYPNLRWSLYYEKEGAANPSADEIAADLAYINTNYTSQPAFFKVNGRPVIFAYGDASDKCAMVDRWLQARAKSGTNFYLVLKLFSGYTSCASQPDSWHEYAPASRSGTYSTDASFISPGFWKVGETSARLPRSVTEFDAAAAAMVTANTKWKLVQTWNEWGEGTSVEPGVQVQQTTSGTATIASNGLPFEDKYIQVMAQRFPALEAGTGVGGGVQVPTTVPTNPPTLVPATPVSTVVVGGGGGGGANQAGTFIFGAGGDFAANSHTDASLRAIIPTGASFFLALGDLDYDQTPSDAAWCDYVKARIGSSFPFQLVTGNHEEGSPSSPGPDGYIGNHAACLPDHFASKPVIPGQPAYPANYYFDYPQSNPIMRVIMISANLKFNGVQYNFNKSEQTNYNALAARIDEAKQAGMWVVVGEHKNCITTGDKSCEIGADLMNLLISKKVDLVLQGHDHTYQRSKQLALGTTCTSVAPGSYKSSCVVDDGSDNTYTRGAGTLFLINGVTGQCCYNVKSSDSEAGYFAKIVGSSGTTTNGFVAYTVSPTRIDARVINTSGSWGDSFSIVGQGGGVTAVPPTPTPTPVPSTPQPTSTAGGSSGGAVITVDVAEDAYVNSDAPSSNFGKSLALRTDASPTIRSYLSFNVPPFSGSVTNALLRVYANTAASIGYSVSGTTGKWTEGTLTFSNAPAFGGAVGNSGPITAGTWTQVNVTSLIKGAGQYSFVMTTINNTATSLVSKEGAAGKHPQLIITTGSSAAPLMAQVIAQPTLLTPTPLPTEIPTIESAATVIAPTDNPTVPATIESSVTNVPTPLPPTPTPNGPTLTIEMNPVDAAVGSNVNAVLKLNNMNNLYGLQTECKVDPTILGGANHTEGSIFTSSNSFVVDTGYQPDGNWSTASSLLNPAPAFTGDGTALSLTYQVLNVGHTALECTALAVDADGNLLPISVVNGSFDNTQPAATVVPTEVLTNVPTEVPPNVPTEMPPVEPTEVPTEVPVIPPTLTPEPPTDVPMTTEEPTLEPTIPSTPGTVSGVVKYEKRPDQAGISITLSQNGTPFAQVQTNADGSFQFNDVPAGQYEVQIVGEGYLAATANIDVQAGQGATVDVTLLAGDLDKSGVVDLADAGLIGANYRVQVPPAPAEADLNGDGFVNLVDLVLIGKNFGKTAQTQ